MSGDSSTSDSEISACSSKFDPVKTLYSSRTLVPVENAPMYNSVDQFEASLQSKNTIVPVGHSELVRQQKEEKEKRQNEEARQLAEANRQRFAKYEAPTPRRPPPARTSKNVLHRIQDIDGPLAVLKQCVDQRLRVKVITRGAAGLRGELHANLIAFDKQWNLALTDVLEIWHKRAVTKRKIPPAVGAPVDKGTAAAMYPVPKVTEKPIGKGVWECRRHVPQLMVRGEHIVLINLVQR
ncbi:PREDICTED: U7 snRNA-associated Sm-like protein LSm11 isoform X1 [Papilio xuthus]|uniref:U7 snRNA-associated Sm-like protein LSm11 isoform X1 n=1 Tax=Papilio xuthus TaxID=66420 RepID=A0AAJ7E856_PAPXU|nr:PREDICTED: U7 snRNA-associated Sm-like protein LSm11 isoform X1 [Papilio xuthus]